MTSPKKQILNTPLSCEVGDPNNGDHAHNSISSSERYLGCKIDRRSSRVGTSEDSDRWSCSLRPPVPGRGDRRVPLKTCGNRKLMKSKRMCTGTIRKSRSGSRGERSENTTSKLQRQRAKKKKKK